MEELVGFGARVHTCSRNDTELTRCLRDWEQKDYAVTGITCDVSIREQRENLLDTVSSMFDGKLNILVSSYFFIGKIKYFGYL